MALFTDQSFPSVYPAGPVAIPRPYLGPGSAQAETYPPANVNDPVVLDLSDSTRVTVFDKKINALRCMEQMRQREQWLLQASDDIFIVSCGTKLLICESTLVNQKLFASFHPCYTGGQLRFAHRSMSSVMTLADALQSVGFCLQGANILDNYDLTTMTSPPRMLIVDWNYKATGLTSTAPGSKLDDGGLQLIYVWP